MTRSARPRTCDCRSSLLLILSLTLLLTLLLIQLLTQPLTSPQPVRNQRLIICEKSASDITLQSTQRLYDVGDALIVIFSAFHICYRVRTNEEQ